MTKKLEELEARIAELELLIAAHRANLVREEWLGNEDMLLQIARIINDVAANVPAAHRRNKQAMAEDAVRHHNRAARKHDVRSKAYREEMQTVLSALEQERKRGG